MRVMNVDLRHEGFAELTGSRIKYWAGKGLPDYEGSLVGFKEEYPEQFKELMTMKAVTSAREDE